MSDSDQAVLYVCTTCLVLGERAREGQSPSGHQLHEAVQSLASNFARVRVMPVVCLANCEQGCSAAVSAPGKWSYVLGYLTPGSAPDVLAYAAAYAQSKKGVVLRAERAESLRHALVARIPSLSLLENEAAE